MWCRWIGEWSREIEREQVSHVGYNSESSSSHCGVSVWRIGWSRSIWQVQASDGEGERLVVDGLDWVNMQEVFTDATDLTPNG